MLVKTRMSSFPITIGKYESIDTAAKIMHDNKIRHMPVMENNELIGLLSYTDIMRAMPSKISTLEQHEATYLFSTIKVKDALPEKQKVITIEEGACIEEAALMMRAYKIGALPVLNSDGKLVGICTENDIFDAFIDLMGVRSSGARITVEIGEKPGQIAEVTEVIRSFNGNITKIAMFPKEGDELRYTMVVRMKAPDIKPIIETLKVHGFQVSDSAEYRDIFNPLS